MRDEQHTPWSDEIGLVAFDQSQDAEGYILPNKPELRNVFCTFEDGVSRGEFYSSMKAGLQASASVELWKVDYCGEKYVCFRKRFYKVIRSFPSSFDHVTLILSEVIR